MQNETLHLCLKHDPLGKVTLPRRNLQQNSWKNTTVSVLLPSYVAVVKRFETCHLNFTLIEMANNLYESERGRAILVVTGWIVLLLVYCTQAGLLVSFLAIHQDSLYGFMCLVFVPALVFTGFFLRRNWKTNKNAEVDKEIWYVWIIWGAYIVPFVVTVAMIFAMVANELTTENTLGVNALKMTLCITPGLLILFLQLAISPSYRKPVLSLSIFAALNIFDGIEMLETFLTQNEKVIEIDDLTKKLNEFLVQNGGNFTNGTEMLKDFLTENVNETYFDLNAGTEISIIVFACVCFLLSSFGLARNKFWGGDEMKERTTTSIVFGFLEIICANLPFLVIRGVIWKKYKHESAVFIAKNIVSLVVGTVECGVLIKMKLQ